VPASCTIVIAPAELLSSLCERIEPVPGELIAFDQADALRALDTIMSKRPALVVLERLFAATPRGAALVNRIKADPALAATEIRIVSHDADYSRVSRRAAGPAAAGAPAPAPAPAPSQGSPASLDSHGTRRERRVPVRGIVNVMVDGNEARLVDVSPLGAQVLSTAVLKPNQRVRMALADNGGAIRVNAVVAWASFEIPGGKGRYRAGLSFSDGDRGALAAFCARHGEA
jgi:hypothetical protein